MIVAPTRPFRPLSEEAYDALRAAILGGRLEPSPGAVEADIARQMATSRSLVREPVRKLEREGLVVYVPRRGTIVVGLSRDDVADAYQLRAHLEAYGARLAATRASEEQLASLLELIERMRACARSNDLAALAAADVEFHRGVCSASGSPRLLLQAWESLNPGRWTLVSGLRATDLGLKQIADRHWPILAALQSRTPDQAEKIMRSHILELSERVLSGLADHARAASLASGATGD